ncbi:MAG: hypothetical protein K2P65_06165 [Lachnospiraceae bacterium]|nr:hypothetical protein [Lachnospiraceae bacterium]
MIKVSSWGASGWFVRNTSCRASRFPRSPVGTLAVMMRPETLRYSSVLSKPVSVTGHIEKALLTTIG